MQSIQELATTNNVRNYGTEPDFMQDEYAFNVMADPGSGPSQGWDMRGAIGTYKSTFGGRTWPVLYYSTQVAFSGSTTATGNVIQQWIQFKNWDLSNPSTDSYYNVVAEVTLSDTGFDTPVYSTSCGTTDLLNGIRRPALNVGEVTCGQVGNFLPSTLTTWTALGSAEGQNGWLTFQVAAIRKFVELPTADQSLLNLKVGDTVQFKSGFKYYSDSNSSPSAWSNPTATISTMPDTYAETLNWQITDQLAIALQATAASVAMSIAALQF